LAPCRVVDTLAAIIAAFVSAVVAAGAFIAGRRFVPASDDTADGQKAARALVAFWLLAAIAVTACLIFAYVAFLHGVTGSGAES
jgi:Na+/proline symporter